MYDKGLLQKVQFHYKKRANPQITAYVLRYAPLNEFLITDYAPPKVFIYSQWFIKLAKSAHSPIFYPSKISHVRYLVCTKEYLIVVTKEYSNTKTTIRLSPSFKKHIELFNKILYACFPPKVRVSVKFKYVCTHQRLHSHENDVRIKLF